MALTFKEFRKANLERCEKAFFPLHNWSASDWAAAIAGEVGEACNLIKKRNRGEPIDTKEIVRELADAVTYIDLLAAYFDEELDEAVIEKFNEVSDRRHSDIKLTT